MNLFGPPNIERLKDGRDVHALIKALGYRNAWYVRKAAAEALGSLNDARAIEPLTISLKDEDKDVRLTAAAALDALHWRPQKDEASAQYWISKKVWEPIAEIGQPAVGPLIEVLTERNWSDCKAAAIVLGRIGDPRSIQPLIAALRNSGWGYIGVEVTDALARIGEASVEPLIATLSDEESDVRLASARTLGEIGDPRAIEPLSRTLKDPHEEVRRTAADALGKFGPPTVELLIGALRERVVPCDVIRSLGRIGDPRAVEPLISALRDDDWAVRFAAAEALGKLGQPAMAPLVATLRETDKTVRQAAAESLEKIGWLPGNDETGAYFWIAKQNWDKCVAIGPQAIEPLVATLKDKDKDVRKAIVLAFGKIRDPRTIEPLIASLRDETESVRDAAAESLGKIRKRDATHPLIAALRDDSGSVRKAASESLGKIHDESAIQPLIAALSDRDNRVRESAAEALGKFGDARAVEPLIGALQSNADDLRKYAAEALGRIGDPRAVPPLIQALEWDYYQLFEATVGQRKATDPESEKELIDELSEKYVFIREAAARALGQIGDPRAVEPLVAALKYVSQVVRRAAVEALGSIGDARAVLSLLAALKDHNADVHDAASEALIKLGAAAVEPLIDELKDERPEVRLASIDVLGKIGDTRAVDPLILALKDENIPVRQVTAIALGRIGAPATEPLVSTLQYENKDVRRAAIDILVKLDWQPGMDEASAYYWIVKRQWDQCVAIGAPAVEPLITALKDQEALSQDEWEERQAVVAALGKIGEPAVRPLIAALKFENEELVKAAVEALGKIGEPAVEPIIASLGDENFGVCMACAEALGKIGDVRAVEPLIDSLKTGRWYMIRKAAAEALGKIGDARAVEPLIAMLRDEYFKVREAAAESLIKIGAPAVEPLIEALQFKEWRMRKAATEVLGKIGDPRAVEPLIAALADEDSDVRKSVAWGLVSLSHAAQLDDEVKQRILSVLS